MILMNSLSNYKIVNRTPCFRSDLCLFVNERKGHIGEVPKETASMLIKPFDVLRKEDKVANRNDLIEARSLARKEVKTRVLQKPNLTNSGYVATGILTFISIILLSIIIFSIVDMLVGN